MTDDKGYIYFMGVCGTGMGSLAGLVKSLGYKVAGSDEHVYPPMSTQLEEWGIDIKKGFRAENRSEKRNSFTAFAQRDQRPSLSYLKCAIGVFYKLFFLQRRELG